MPDQKSMICIIVANGTPIQCNIHIINMNVVNYVWVLTSCIIIFVTTTLQ